MTDTCASVLSSNTDASNDTVISAMKLWARFCEAADTNVDEDDALRGAAAVAAGANKAVWSDSPVFGSRRTRRSGWDNMRWDCGT